MISLEGAVRLVLWILGAGIIFGALIWLTRYAEKEFPNSAPAPRFARIVIVVLAVLVLIGIVLDFMGHPIIRFSH